MSAFEEAIYRIYDRSIASIVEDESPTFGNAKFCRYLEKLMLGVSLFYLFSLIVLHIEFNGNQGCLANQLRDRMLSENRTELLPSDAILQINIPSSYYLNDIEDPDDFDGGSTPNRRRRRLQQVRNDKWRSLVDGPPRALDKSKVQVPFQSLPFLSSTTRAFVNAFGVGREVYGNVLGRISRILKANQSTPAKEHMLTNQTASLSLFNNTIPAKYLMEYDYEFSTDLAVLSLSNELRAKHNFHLINISLDQDTCFGSNSFMQAMSLIGGSDNVVLNNIASTLRKGGMLISSVGDYYIWSHDDIVLYNHAGEWVTFKLGMAMKIFTLFFVMSNATALLVRVLISTGAVIMYSCMACTGEGLVPHRMRPFTLAYPWLGVPIELYISRRQSPVPFISAHLSKIICYYMLYEALQFACSLWFYDENQPDQKQIWLFAAMMFWEYYSMIYVRSAETILIFPRALFAAFALYHIYLYSFPMGFHMLALSCLMTSMGYLMIFCLRNYEKAAYNRGVVSIEQPRAFSNIISWPTWNHSISPDVTLFMPLQARSTPVYANDIAPLPHAAVDARNDAEPPAQENISAREPAAAGTEVELPTIGGRLRNLLAGTGQQYQRLEEGTD